MTYHRSQAHRTVRIPGWWITLALMIVSALVAAGVIWFALSLFFSMGSYIQSVTP